MTKSYERKVVENSS